jgi:hypothetical protein
MSTVKTWVLMQDQLTTEEIEWIKALKVEVKSEALYNTVYSYGETRRHCIGYHFELKTRCEKQETMLQLKYSKDLQLTSILYPADENFNLASHGRSTAR